MINNIKIIYLRTLATDVIKKATDLRSREYFLSSWVCNYKQNSLCLVKSMETHAKKAEYIAANNFLIFQ